MTDEPPKRARRRTFSHTGEAWYRETALGNGEVDELLLMISDRPNDGVVFEFAIKWHMLSGGASPTLDVTEDAWTAFAELPDVFAWLATQSGVNPTPAEVMAGLLALGFIDETSRVGPKTRDDISRVAEVVRELFDNETIGEAMLRRSTPLSWCQSCGAWVESDSVQIGEHLEWADKCRTCGGWVDESCEIPDEAVEAALRMLAKEKP